MKAFKPGTVVVLNEKKLKGKWWDELTEKKRQEFYGLLGYGSNPPKCFVFITEIVSAPGHCVVMDLDTNKLLSMYHTENFRKATDSEF